MGPWRCLLLLPLLAVALRAQQQQFMEYVERRLTLLEVGTHAGPTSPHFTPPHGSRGLPPWQWKQAWGEVEMGWGQSRAGVGCPCPCQGPAQPSTSLTGTGA